MSRRVHYAPWFDADLHFRTAWYAEAGGEELAERFVTAVKTTVSKLSDNPRLGHEILIWTWCMPCWLSVPFENTFCFTVSLRRICSSNG